jgi:hypothetical protein
VERGWTAVGNELLRIIGLLNDKLKITETISSILKDVSDFMSDTGQASTALDVAKERVTLLENRLAGLKATMDSPVWGTIAGIFEDYPALVAKTEKELSLMRDAVAFLEAETGDLNDTLDNTVERFANWDQALEEVNKELKAAAKANKELAKTFDKGTPVAATQAIRDLLRGLNSDIDDLIENQELFGLKAEESGRKVETQFINVTETIQNRLQPIVADFYESMFGGKALNSVRDFLNSLKNMFIRVFAEIAAKITINKLFGGLLGGLGISIGGSAAGGAGAALGLGGIGAALKGGASKIGGFLGIGGAAGGATAFGLGTGGVGTGGLIAGTSLGTGASISTGFGGGAAAPAAGLGGFGAFAGPLAAVGIGLAISKFGSSRSPEEVWRDMWYREVLPLVESGAAEAANIIGTTLWDEVDQDAIESTKTMGKQFLFVQDRAQEFATAVETIIPNAFTKALEGGGLFIRTQSEGQRKLVDDILAAWNGRLEPGVLSTIASIDLAGAQAQQAMADGFVFAAEQAQFGIEGLGTVSSEVFAAMVSAAASVAGEIGGIVGRAEAARAAVQAIPGATTVPVLPGFAGGGDFLVGGRAGVDANVVAFRASRGETVTITPPSGSSSQEKLLRQILGQLTQQRLDVARLAVAR